MYQLCNGHGFYTLILLPNLLIHENAEKIVQKMLQELKGKFPKIPFVLSSMESTPS